MIDHGKGSGYKMFAWAYGKNRKVSAASYIFYAEGCLHPDRIMEEHDFVYIVNGEWEICQNDEVYAAVTDDVVVLRAGEHHYGTQKCRQGTRTMYFHISADSGDAVSGKEGTEERAALNSLIHCGKCPRVKLLFQELIAVWHEPEGNKDRKMNAVFELLLLELAECCSLTCGAHDASVGRAVEEIARTPQRFLKTSELADCSGICEKTLNQRFRKVYGKTAYQYQMEEKIRLVQQFLQDYPDAKLQSAAVNFGFYDEFHLNKTFKKYVGMPPGVYRRSLSRSENY